MIIQSLCNTCLQPYTLLVESSDQELLKQVASADGHTCPCPRLCGGSINLVGDRTIRQMTKDPRLRTPLTLSVKEIYKAIHGAGLPDEVPKSPVLVESLLKSHKVLAAKTGETHGQVYLYELVLEGGITLHLTSGAYGAVVLKVTKEKSDGR